MSGLILFFEIFLNIVPGLSVTSVANWVPFDNVKLEQVFFHVTNISQGPILQFCHLEIYVFSNKYIRIGIEMDSSKISKFVMKLLLFMRLN